MRIRTFKVSLFLIFLPLVFRNICNSDSPNIFSVFQFYVLASYSEQFPRIFKEGERRHLETVLQFCSTPGSHLLWEISKQLKLFPLLMAKFSFRTRLFSSPDLYNIQNFDTHWLTSSLWLLSFIMYLAEYVNRRMLEIKKQIICFFFINFAWP